MRGVEFATLHFVPRRAPTTLLQVALAAIGLLVCLAGAALPADWPMFRADASRSGYTPDSLASNLELIWTYQPLHPPQPAWRGPDTRMAFDCAHRPIVAGSMLFFGSSADNKVYALDATTGQERWTFFTGGPIRFAPAVWRDRVFVVSDDGYLYCLSAAKGTLLWKKRGGPRESMVLGNDRMISRWPVRGGPLVLDDTVYFGAGIWPSEGIFLYALDAATGDVVWLNDTSGAIEMDQPHGGARAKSGVSAQGHLAASSQHLFIPTGRAVPAAFDRSDGRFRYFLLQKYGKQGGSSVTVIDDVFFNGHEAYRAEDGARLARGIGAHAVAAGERYIVYADKGCVSGIDRAQFCVEKETLDRKGNPTVVRTLAEPAWTIERVYEGNPTALILAGNVAALGTDAGKVMLFDVANRSVVDTREIDGVPLDLAAADGRLYVSTDRGWISCFASGEKRDPIAIRRTKDPSPYPDNGLYAVAAGEIIQRTGVTEGYCLDLACGDGRLAYELAKQTDLVICGIDSDPEMVALARKRLDAAGLYGVRVTIHHGNPSDTHYPRYFADLIVSGRSITDGSRVVPMTEVIRLQRPYGGVASIGKPSETVQRVRGPLEGAGSWTHQYCDPANTLCSSDVLVKSPLGMLWFKDNPLEMPSRHGRGPAPLFSEGRLFVEGNHAIQAVDAYNGRHLWEYPLPDILIPYDQEHLVGTAATGSNFCVAGDSLYVSTENRCLRLDTATGKKLAQFEAPLRNDGTKGTWGYLACVDGILFGSLVNEEHIVKWAFVKADMSDLFSESELFFALDAATGKEKWTYTAEESIRHNAITTGGGRVFLIDRPLAEGDLLNSEEARARRRGEDSPTADTGKSEPGPPKLLALDAETGGIVWQATEDVVGTLLLLSVEHDVLLMGYQHTRFKLPSESGGRLAAFRASTGEPLWEAAAPPVEGYRYSSRPVINGDIVYLEPGALNLLTGRKLDFSFERSYACGIVSGAKNLLAFRSATLGYVDLSSDRGTENYGGIRPGCWVNAIPAGGMLLLPDASSRCTCSYLIKSSIALGTID